MIESSLVRFVIVNGKGKEGNQITTPISWQGIIPTSIPFVTRHGTESGAHLGINDTKGRGGTGRRFIKTYIHSGMFEKGTDMRIGIPYFPSKRHERNNGDQILMIGDTQMTQFAMSFQRLMGTSKGIVTDIGRTIRNAGDWFGNGIIWFGRQPKGTQGGQGSTQ